MGLSASSTGIGALAKELNIERETVNDKIIALGGNPNVGKSTIFNNLTGLNQHTGNWPGKTVANAQGKYTYKDMNFILVDIPGTYSLMANSVEEEVARDFICFGNPDTTVIIVDATCLERNLNLVLQTLEITPKVILCVNLMDEAKRKNIDINLHKLSNELGIPVVGTSATRKKGLDELMDVIYKVSNNKILTKPISIKYEDEIERVISDIEVLVRPLLKDRLNSRWVALKLIEGDETLLDSINRYLDFNVTKQEELINQIYESKAYLRSKGIDENTFRDKIVTTLVSKAEELTNEVVVIGNKNYNNIDRKIDQYLTSTSFGIPIMIVLLGIIFWITITGANIPSKIIANGLFWIQDRLTDFFVSLGTPPWIHGILVMGMYRTLAWVVSVMLPPMAIFFPLFTMLEDLGYLPRVAFNLDNFFKKLTHVENKPLPCVWDLAVMQLALLAAG